MNSGFRALSVSVFTTLIAASCVTASAKDFKTEKVTVSTETVAGSLNHPWSLAFLPDGALLVTERVGNMRIITNGKVSEPIANVPKVAVMGQGGLLDVALAPDFPDKRRNLFHLFTTGQGGSRNGIGKRETCPRPEWRST